ncbi:MAG: sigma 54-interacting transcriptional regulator [Acidobacteriaceae bacterium]|jgi:DNA-binding NtrC family response regulator
MASNHFISAEPFQPAIPPEHQELPGGPLLSGESAAVRRLRSQVRRIAPYFRTALVHGEPGAGKELAAHCLHAGSPGSDGPFIVAQAAMLAEPLDHAPRPLGMRSAQSLVESAHGGTLFLKGIAELSFAQQAGLLRFLQACEQLRVATPGAGRVSLQPADSRPRIIAASDRDLRPLAAIGQFRQDLYAHLSAVEILVPPLRQRTDDIPVICEWLLRRLAHQTRQTPRLLSEPTLWLLQKSLWPNNLRQLERVVCQAAALAEADSIEPRHLLTVVEPGFGPLPAPSAAKSERLSDVVQRHVLDVLGRCGGNKLRTAKALGISRSTLYRMLDAGAAGSTS